MPTDAREQRKAQRAENARRWGLWLTQAMAQEKIEPKDIINGSNGTIDKGTVSHWMLGDYGVSTENALVVARILRQPPAEALRAAGHDTLADLIAEAEKRSRLNLEAELREHLTGLNEELDARIAHYLPATTAARRDGHGSDQEGVC